MNKNIWNKKRTAAMIALLYGMITAFFIICISVVFTLNFKSLYYYDITRLEISETTGMPEETIRKNYDALIEYSNITGPKRLVIPDFPMSESGRIHFEEVKHIFSLVEWIAVISFVLLIPMFVLSVKKRKFLWLKYAAVITIALPVFLGVMLALNWRRFFILFHEIVFSNDYWIFDSASDPVITILPNTFFMHCAIMIFTCIIIGGMICAVIYRRNKKREKG